ncbi:hypothetical protein Tco_1179034 [Tanacetum coccineum]
MPMNNQRSRFHINTLVKFNIGSTSDTHQQKGKSVHIKLSCHINFNDIDDEDEDEVESQSNPFEGISNNNVKLRLIGTRERDRRKYDLPTASEVAALIVGDFNSTEHKRDIILERQGGDLKRISELHPSYLALQYKLLFLYAKDGYHTDIYRRDVTNLTLTDKKTRVSMREWFAYRLQDIPKIYSMILNLRRLFQQFLVGGYTMIESKRMSYIRREQKDLMPHPVNGGNTG